VFKTVVEIRNKRKSKQLVKGYKTNSFISCDFIIRSWNTRNHSKQKLFYEHRTNL